MAPPHPILTALSCHGCGTSATVPQRQVSSQRTPTRPLGVHDVTLVVTDDRGATDRSTCTIEVRPSNVPPIASAAVVVADRTRIVLLDGSWSCDPDGRITGWAWSFGDGSTGSGAHSEHEYATDGTYVATLTVTDDRGSSASTDVPVVVTTHNEPPMASFVAAANGRTMTFDGSTSTDPDGPSNQPVSHLWNFGDGTTGIGRSPTHTYSTDGPFNVTLMVADLPGATGSVTHSVGAGLLANLDPSAQPQSVTSGLNATFNGLQSTDPDGTVVGYEWSFGDDAVAVGPSTSHTYDVPGVYTVELLVTDNDGATNLASTVINVTNLPQEPTTTTTAPATTTTIVTTTTEPRHHDRPRRPRRSHNHHDNGGCNDDD